MNEPTTYFSTTMTQAHAKFANAACNAGARVEVIPHPHHGPDGEVLQVAVARLGPSPASAALLVLSGTHGVEGFAGAGIQTGMLRQGMVLPEDTAVVMVHLINPWGLAWNRREDHENIDVFRNSLYCADLVAADPLFDVIDDAMDLPHWPEHAPERDARMRAELTARHGGMVRLIAAVRHGQHHRPKSMSYHGNHPCWSRTVLQDVLCRQLVGCHRLAVLDIHTGFGEYGQGLVMSYDPPGDPRRERVGRWFNGAIYVPGADADIPPHSKSPYGFIAEWVPELAVTAAILEFGTFPPDEFRDIFPANHYHHIYGDPRSEQAMRVGMRYRHYFYPEEPCWIDAVWQSGQDAIRRMLVGLEHWQA